MKKLKNQRLTIRIRNTQRKITINKKAVANLAKQALKIKGIDRAELSILFVGKRFIRSLNKKFRKIDRPTDVLAFSMRQVKVGRAPALKPEKTTNAVGVEILGDVVICPEIARSRARIYQTTEEVEIYLYLIHGILHLLGCDDTSKKGRWLMKKEQARIFKKITKR